MTTHTQMAEPPTDNMSPADDSDPNIFINPADGLPNEHPVQLQKKATSSDEEDAGNEDRLHNPQSSPGLDDDLLDDLPTSLIVTNIHSDVFSNDDLKGELEDVFRQYSPLATFHWLKSFKRLRVYFDSPGAAAAARLQLHQYPFHASNISCYFAQPVTPVSQHNLQPPAPVKQFLISPPASPPAGWEPREECEPLVNHDLLAALANLSPGESHELHHPTSDSHPAIIVHTALAAAATGDGVQKIVQTKCPERA